MKNLVHDRAEDAHCRIPIKAGSSAGIGIERTRPVIGPASLLVRNGPVELGVALKEDERANGENDETQDLGTGIGSRAVVGCVR